MLEALQKGIPEDAFTVWDVSQFGFYARTHWQVTRPKTYIDSGYSFNLGYAFPTALGVKVAKPDRAVVCVAGDGGFMFNASELSTAVKYGINLVTVIFRNDSYGNVARDLEKDLMELTKRITQSGLRQIRGVVRGDRDAGGEPAGLGDDGAAGA